LIQAAKMREASEAAEKTVEDAAVSRVEAFQVCLTAGIGWSHAEDRIRTRWSIPCLGSYDYTPSFTRHGLLIMITLPLGSWIYLLPCGMRFRRRMC